MKRFFKSLFNTLIIMLLLFAGSTVFFIFKNHIENPGDMISEFKNGDNCIQFLLMGIDNLDATTAESTRSDTIMLVNMDLDENKASIISIPRDTYTKIEGYKAQKINHSYNYGGPELTLQTVNNLLGTDIKYYMTMDYKFVKDVVDIIGGVEVDVPIKMDYEDEYADPPLYIHLEPGLQTLDGDEAIQFLRFRHGYADQDLGRVRAQQQFVTAFMDKLKSPATFVKAPLLLKCYDRSTKSDIPFSKIVKMGIGARHLDLENITAETLPGEAGYRNRVSYFFNNKEKTEQLLIEEGIK